MQSVSSFMRRPTLALRSSMDSETASGLKGRDCPAVAQFNGVRDSASNPNADLKNRVHQLPQLRRTLFDLQETTAKIREVTSHLKGIKIGIMGCIVNGPGEMADADYGYVGTGPGKITLYKEKEVVEKNVPEERAVDALIELIRSHGDWVEPVVQD